MTLCGMESAHKYQVCNQAMKTCYKMGNNVTAAHFARVILELEPTGVSIKWRLFLLTMLL